MVSAKDKMLKVLQDNVGKLVKRDVLREASGNVSEWARSARTLKQEGWDIETVNGPNGGRILRSLNKEKGKERGYIDLRTRALVLKNAHYRCEHCGRSPKDDGVKIDADHKIPVDLWEGPPDRVNDISNLESLCTDCNLGKKNFFKDEDPAILRKIFKTSSDRERIKILADASNGNPIHSSRFMIITKGRDWMRAVRSLREDGYEVDFDRKTDCYRIAKH